MNIKLKYHGVDKEYKFTEEGEVMVSIDDILLIQTYTIPAYIKIKEKYYLLVIKYGPSFLINETNKLKCEKILGEIK